jgi:hypothetical protein
MTSSSLTANEIRNSLTRLQNAFHGDYSPIALHEGSRKVGCLRIENNKIFFTFRGSVNSLTELFTCLDVRKSSMEQWGLAGKVHAGLHSSFCKVQQSIDACLTRYLPRRDLQGMEVVVEGYSRGSALAMLTAAYLAHRYAANNLTILTYSPMNIFDETAAHAYKERIPHQWNFVCTDDFFPKWFGPSWLGFCPSGDRITFSANESPSFVERVRRRAYTYLAHRWLFRFFIPVRFWEAHMPATYNDGAILAFNRHT